MPDSNKWSEFVIQKYIAFRGDKIGREGSVTAFAKWLGVSQPQLSRMMSPNGQTPGSHKTINAFVDKYGIEVFDALGMPIPGDDDTYGSIEPHTRDQAITIILELAERFEIPVDILDDRQDQKRRPE